MANVAINRILFRRGNTAVTSVYTGPLGEIVIDTDLDSIRVQDGVTAGGSILATQASLANATANVTSLTSNAASQQSQIGNLIANTAVLSGRIGATESNIALIQADVTTLVANAGAQAGSIATLTTNAAVQSGAIATLESNAAVQAGAIATLQSQVYGNANVASYLPTYSANTAAVLTTASQPYVTSLGNLVALQASGAFSTTGIIYANAGVSASGTTSTASGSFRVLGGAGISGNLLAGSIENTPIGTAYPSYGSFTYAFFNLGHDAVILNNVTQNSIRFGGYGGGGGSGTPTLTTLSAGAKLVLWNSINSAGAGYSIGYESNYMWFGANTATASQGFRWYGGVTLAATLSATGNLILGGTGNLQAASALISGNLTATSLSTSGSATVGGGLLVNGNLTVQGTTTTVNSTTLDVADKNITVAKGAASAAAANGAGLTIDGAGATLLYANTGDRFEFNKNVYTSGNVLATNITNLESNAAVQAGLIADLTSNAAVQAGDIATIYANLGAVSGSLVTLTSNAAVQAGAIATLESNAAVQAGLLAGLESNAAVQAGLISGLTNGTTTFGNLIPSANVTYSLGSPTAQWKDLYLSGNTIFLGGASLSVANGAIESSLPITADVTATNITVQGTRIEFASGGYIEEAEIVGNPGKYGIALNSSDDGIIGMNAMDSNALVTSSLIVSNVAVQINVANSTPGGNALVWFYDQSANLTWPTGEQFNGPSITNWDTAYGWGNHSLAGYTTYANANVASYLTTFTGNIQSPSITNSLSVGGNVNVAANVNVTGYINGKRQAVFRKHSTSQNVSNNSDTLVQFDTASVTVGNCGITYNSTTLPGRFYNATSEAKLIQVSATVVFEGNVSGSSGERTVWISQNGLSTNRKAQQTTALANSTSHVTHTVSTALYLTSGESFDVYCRQGSGSALLIGSSSFGLDSGSYITITEV